MNIYYAPSSQINNGFAELIGQEATHASKVMRASEGDELVLVDGEGGWYRGLVQRITKKTVQVAIDNKRQIPAPDPLLILGMGIIKKRDRLEFAIEKAVELGAAGICLFRSVHSVKENVRMDRLESIAISAMKQSLRAWLPDISVYDTVESVLDEFSDAEFLAAHEKVDEQHSISDIKKGEGEKLLLLVGPEGGFSSNEVDLLKERNAKLISLGANRLRTETAAVAFLSQFIR